VPSLHVLGMRSQISAWLKEFVVKFQVKVVRLQISRRHHRGHRVMVRLVGENTIRDFCPMKNAGRVVQLTLQSNQTPACLESRPGKVRWEAKSHVSRQGETCAPRANKYSYSEVVACMLIFVFLVMVFVSPNYSACLIDFTNTKNRIIPSTKAIDSPSSSCRFMDVGSEAAGPGDRRLARP